MMFGTPDCIWNVEATLGEGALWSAREQAVWFVDIKRHTIYRLDTVTGERRRWTAPEQVGFVLPTQDGGWIAGLQSGLHRFDLVRSDFTPLQRPEDHPPTHRLNDGHVDSRGRLWFGTMHDAETGQSGKLYRLLDDGRSAIQDTGYGIANGPSVSPDGKTLYHTDTLFRVIYSFDLHDDGSLGPRREFARITRAGASPDGLAVDSDGCIWTALFGGWGLERFSSDGRSIGYVRLPCANATKPAFGGEDLKTLYVTTATLHLDDAQRARQPLAGALFALQIETPGLPTHEIHCGL